MLGLFSIVKKRFLAIIMFLGNHPLSVGLFSIFGLVASIAAFQIDRQEARETTEMLTGIRDEITNDELYPWFSYNIPPETTDFRRRNDLDYCRPVKQDLAIATKRLADFLIDNQGGVVYLRIELNFDECEVWEFEQNAQLSDRLTKLLVSVAHSAELPKAGLFQPNIGVDKGYLELSKDIFQPSFLIYLQDDHHERNLNELYYISIWPPLATMQTYNYFSDEYGLNLMQGVFKVSFPSASGGNAINLFPVEALDSGKLQNTIQLMNDEP